MRVLLARVLVAHGGGNDHLLARLPVDRRRDRVFRAHLQRVEQPQHLVEVAPRAHRIDEHRLHFLVGTDDEDRAHGRVVRRGARARRGVRMDHVVELRDVEVRVADERIVDLRALRLLDVLHPARVVGHGIDAQADDLRVALVEFGFQPRHVAELRRAHGREVLRMGEEDRPAVADPLVEPDLSLRRFGGKVRRFVPNSDCHFATSRC